MNPLKLISMSTVLLLSIVSLSAQAGIAACYTGKPNSQGIYTDTEYVFLKDGLSTGLALATMIRQHMKSKGIKQTPVCTMADSSGYYILATHDDADTNVTIYALGMSNKNIKDAEVAATKLITSRYSEWSATRGYRIIDKGKFGPTRNSAVKIHCSVDTAATIFSSYLLINNQLIGQYSAGGINMTLNHGKIDHPADNDQQLSLSMLGGLISSEDMQYTTDSLVDAACGNRLTPPLRRSMARSISAWLLNSGHERIQQINKVCRKQTQDYTSCIEKLNTPSGNRG